MVYLPGLAQYLFFDLPLRSGRYLPREVADAAEVLIKVRYRACISAPRPSSRQAANQEVSAAATTFLRPPMQTQIPADCETGPVKEPPARLRAPVCLGGEAFGNGRHNLAMRV